MSHHILLVDDEEEVLTILEDLFSTREYQISKATNGQEAIDLLGDISPDLILADYQMPAMNGIELFKATQDLYPDTIRILITAHGDLQVAMAAINEDGVYKFITKPCNNNDLFVIVQRALEHYDLILQQRAFADMLELMVEENTEEIDRLRTALKEMVARIQGLIP